VRGCNETRDLAAARRRRLLTGWMGRAPAAKGSRWRPGPAAAPGPADTICAWTPGGAMPG